MTEQAVLVHLRSKESTRSRNANEAAAAAAANPEKSHRAELERRALSLSKRTINQPTSSMCHPRGRTISVASLPSSAKVYVFPPPPGAR